MIKEIIHKNKLYALIIKETYQKKKGISFFTGNVTGSNAVNVFLGLGTPWLMATIYWSQQGNYDSTSALGIKYVTKYAKQFGNEQWFKDVISGASPYVYISPAGSLGPSVATFTILACMCVCVLMIRRKFAGGELGGPQRLRNVSFVVLISFWLIYVSVSASIAYSQ